MYRLISVVVAASAGLILLPITAEAANPMPYYWLPWQNGVHQTVTQGNDQGTHVNMENYAWDFGGSWTVRAARGGVVSMVKSDGQGGCCSSTCAGDGNYVVINTGDGYQSLYLHLAYQSVLVSVGQRVNAYDQLGLSDSTGWVCGTDPSHLHFMVESTCGGWYCQSDPASFLDPTIPFGRNGVPNTGDQIASANHVSWTDLFLYNPTGGYPGVQFANGAGGWSGTGDPYFSGGWSIYPGRYDRKAETDLFLLNQTTGQSYVELAKGDGSWDPHQGPQFSTPWTVYTGDFTGNGFTDLFLYRESTGETYVELADGNGGWRAVQGLQFITGWSFFPGHYCSIDPNKCPSPHNSLMTDLFLYNFSTGWSRVLTADGSGHWRDTGAGPTYTNRTDVVTGQFDSGGYTGVCFYDYFSGATWIEQSDGKAGWTEHAGQSIGSSRFLYTGDFNGDGLTDIFVQTYRSPSTYVFLANGDYTWRQGPVKSIDPSWSVYPVALDGSAKSDLFLYNSSTGANEVYLADGNGGWGTPIQNPLSFASGANIYAAELDWS